MKKLLIISFLLALLVSAVAVAQYGAQQPDNSKSSMSTKAVSITGTISDDGKMFLSRCYTIIQCSSQFPSNDPAFHVGTASAFFRSSLPSSASRH